jgi:RNA polymerase sigma factor (sigma-70 family)
MDDRAAFEALFRAHVGAVHAYALRRTDAATADEVVADTFLVCWRRFDRVPDEPLPWLYAVARRCLANRLRAARRERARTAPPPGAAPAAADAYEQRAAARDVLAALAALPAKEREALQLCAWEGLTPAVAARVAGCTAPAFRVRLHRARRRLAAQLQTNPRSDAVAELRTGGEAL